MYNKYCEIRDSKGVKDATVAKETGIPKSTFTDWKNGRSEPKKEKLQKIADYFNVPISYFVSDVKKSRQLDGYYINDETARMAQTIFENKELRALFDAAQDAKPDDLKTAYDVLLALKRKENE